MCRCCSTACLLFNSTDAALPVADVKALILANIAGTSANRGNAEPFLWIVWAKVVLSAAC